jgi:HNH endonuclease
MIGLPCAQQQDRTRRYNKTWRAASAQYLRQHRKCIYCKEVGRDSQSELVDHLKPLSRGGSLMAQRNWAPCCHLCHNTWVKSLEMGGLYQHWTDASGAPLPPGPVTRKAILEKASPAALKEFLAWEN